MDHFFGDRHVAFVVAADFGNDFRAGCIHKSFVELWTIGVWPLANVEAASRYALDKLSNGATPAGPGKDQIGRL
jgi:hypothetical protein